MRPLSILTILSIAGCASAAPTIETKFRVDSDPKAAALAQRMVEAAGGSAAWARVREIGWLQVTTFNGRAAAIQEFTWDRLNDRGRLVQLAWSGAISIAMVPLEGTGGAGHRVLPSGCRAGFTTERATVLAESASSLRRESFLLLLPFSLQSGDVRLQLIGERVTPTVAIRDNEPPRYDVLRVERKGEVLDIVVSKETLRPVVIEKRRAADGSIEGTRLDEWRSFGALELATRRTDIGSTANPESTQLELPPQWANHVAVKPTRIATAGTVTLISQVESHQDVDERLFTPSLAR